MPSDQPATQPTDPVVAATVRWLERAVIGLNLCPFARSAHADGRIRYAVTDADTPEALVEALLAELEFLAAAAPDAIETTLLIHPRVFAADFLDFNDFLDVAEAAVEELGLTGEVQVASFHPRYQFAGTEPDAVENCTNRSPYPMLHLLREDSVERAVEAWPDTDQIYQRNIETLRRIGREGWNKLEVGPEAKSDG